MKGADFLLYYANAKTLYPPDSPALTPEQQIPEGAVLTGLAWDYTDATVITYDKTEAKLMWIQSSTGSLVASATVDSQIDDVIGMTSFQDRLYILTYEGDGHLAVFTGVISNARDTSVLSVTRHDVPYSTANPLNLPLFDLTHTVPPRYLRYHPDFCNIFSIGSSIYLLIGVANNTTSGTVPAELGQYVVEYDLNGIFRSQVSVDFTPAGKGRDRTILGVNGTAVAAAYHDGALALLCREVESVNHPSVVHVLTYINKQVTYKDSFWYIVGNITPYGDLMVRGRYAYILTGNRIMKSEVMMIALDMDNGWPSSSTVDLGNLASGQTVYRKLTCWNASPASLYKELVVSSTDPNLTISAKDNPSEYDYSDNIVITQPLYPGDSFSFWVCLTAPVVRNEEFAPYQYYNKLVFSPRVKQDFV